MTDGRMFWEILVREKSRRAVEVAERVATGLANEKELFDALENAYGCYYCFDGNDQEQEAALAACRVAEGNVQDASEYIIGAIDSECKKLARDIHVQIIGELENPFRKEEKK